MRIASWAITEPEFGYSAKCWTRIDQCSRRRAARSKRIMAESYGQSILVLPFNFCPGAGGRKLYWPVAIRCGRPCAYVPIVQILLANIEMCRDACANSAKASNHENGRLL